MIYLDNRPIVGVDIPYGYCHCGCGQKTRIASRNRKADGWIKGDPVQYIHGHGIRSREPLILPDPNPSGLCMCGCSRRTELAPQTHTKSGWVKGRPMRFIQGHRLIFKKSLPVEPRFWSQIVKSPEPDGCWVWIGSLDTTGYGQMSVNGIMTLVHRISYEIHRGPIPEGKKVLHKCDNPPCGRPDHLFLGDDIDNIRDRNAKGRQAKGEAIHTAKVTASDVIEIRRLRGAGISLQTLADQFGLTTQHTHNICGGKSWKHIPLP